jgi:tetratricopeptide (TPR) repeat protein
MMRLWSVRLLGTVAFAALLAGMPAGPVGADENPGAYLAARSAAANRNYSEAAVWFQLALEADPDNPGLMEGVVQSQIGLGDFEAAAATGQRLIDAGQPGQGAPIALMVQWAKAENYDAILADTTGGGVNTLYDRLTKAWASVGKGDMSTALAGFDALAADRTTGAFGLYHKALALASVGDYEGADDILSGRVAGPIAVMQRGVMAHVQILSQLERNSDALKVLDATFGTTADPGIIALRARLEAGEPIPFDTVRNAKDGLAEVMFTIAGGLSGEADDTYTLIYARAAADLRPDNTDALLMTAGLLEQLGQFDLATQSYAAVPADDPAFFIAEIGRAETLRKSGKAEASIEVLQALARTDGEILGVQVALGDALRREERFAEAVAAYDAAMTLIPELGPQHWPIVYSRAVSHERSDNWPAAEADFRKALELNPDQPQVLNYLGYSFVDRGENLDEALALIERAVAAEPQSGYIVDSLAWAYFRLGRYEDAVEPMEKASLLEPVDPVVTDHLGDVYWAVGRVLEAQFQWRRALSFEPEEAEAARIRRKLEVGLDVVRAEEGVAPIRPLAADEAVAPPVTDGN